MSVSAFYRNFQAVTAMSPIQLAESTAGYVHPVIWAALVLMIVLAAQAGWLCYGSRRLFAATSQAQHWRLMRQAISVSAGVGAAILIAGVVLFVAKGHNWLILAVTWPFGLLHIGLNVAAFRRARKRTGRIPPEAALGFPP